MKKRPKKEEKVEEEAKKEDMEKEKAPTAEAKIEDMKKEKAPAASSSMITTPFNNAKAKGHTRGLIVEHGYIKFH